MNQGELKTEKITISETYITCNSELSKTIKKCVYLLANYDSKYQGCISARNYLDYSHGYYFSNIKAISIKNNMLIYVQNGRPKLFGAKDY